MVTVAPSLGKCTSRGECMLNSLILQRPSFEARCRLHRLSRTSGVVISGGYFVRHGCPSGRARVFEIHGR